LPGDPPKLTSNGEAAIDPAPATTEMARPLATSDGFRGVLLKAGDEA
jgi:hypothetical protein